MGLFLAGISWSVRGVIVAEGNLVGDYSLHFCAWSQLASCFWWASLLLGNIVLIWAAASSFLLLPAERPPRFHVCRYVQIFIEVRLLFLISDCLYFVLIFERCCLLDFLMPMIVVCEEHNLLWYFLQRCDSLYCFGNRRLVWLSDVDATSSISCSIFSWSVGEDLCPGCGWVAFVQLCQCQCFESGFTITWFRAYAWYGQFDFRFEDKWCPVVRKHFTLFWSRCKDVRLFSLLLLQDMVEACSFQPFLGQVLEAFVQWMVWHSFHIFSPCVRS